MFERFTDGVQRARVFAKYEASNLRSSSIKPEHMLLGLIRVEWGLFVTTQDRATLIIEKVKEKIKIESVGLRSASDLPISEATKRVFGMAAMIADGVCHKHIGTEHLLLAILEPENVLPREVIAELEQNGVAIEAVKLKLRSEKVKLVARESSAYDPQLVVLEDRTSKAPHAFIRFDSSVSAVLWLENNGFVFIDLVGWVREGKAALNVFHHHSKGPIEVTALLAVIYPLASASQIAFTPR